MLGLHRADTAAAVVVVAAGDVDLLTVARLRAAVTAGIGEAAGRPVVLDLSAVTFLGSNGLAALVDAVGMAERRGEPLRVVVDHTRPVIRPIQLAGLDDILSLYNSVDDAVAA